MDALLRTSSDSPSASERKKKEKKIRRRRKKENKREKKRRGDSWKSSSREDSAFKVHTVFMTHSIQDILCVKNPVVLLIALAVF